MLINKLKPTLTKFKNKLTDKFSKRTLIIASIIALMLALVAGGFLTRSLADSAATKYGKAVDAHFVAIYAETDREKGRELISKPVKLQPIFMGSMLSSRYKQASTELKPTYEEIIKNGYALTGAVGDYTKFAQDIIADIMKALAEPTKEVSSDSKPTKEMEATLIAILAKADKLDAVADKIEKIDFLKTYKTRGALIQGLRDMATARRGVVQAYSDYIGDLTTWGTEKMKAVQSESTVGKDFDNTAYTKKAAGYVKDYDKASEDSVSAMTSIVDELQASTYLKDLQTKIEKFNKDIVAFRVIVDKFNKQ